MFGSMVMIAVLEKGVPEAVAVSGKLEAYIGLVALMVRV